jgi:hypothetical protein
VTVQCCICSLIVLLSCLLQSRTLSCSRSALSGAFRFCMRKQPVFRHLLSDDGGIGSSAGAQSGRHPGDRRRRREGERRKGEGERMSGLKVFMEDRMRLNTEIAAPCRGGQHIGGGPSEEGASRFQASLALTLNVGRPMVKAAPHG